MASPLQLPLMCSIQYLPVDWGGTTSFTKTAANNNGGATSKHTAIKLAIHDSPVRAPAPASSPAPGSMPGGGGHKRYLEPSFS